MRHIFIVVSLLFTSFLMGGSPSVEITYGKSNYSMDAPSQGETKSISEDGVSFAIGIGLWSRESRFLIYSSLLNYDIFKTVGYFNLLAINYDKLFRLHRYFVPYVGVGVGYGKLSGTTKATNFDYRIDYSIRAGITLFDFDFGYDYKILSIHDGDNNNRAISSIYFGIVGH